MKIAIHHRKGSFSDRWIEYCETNSINYKVVNAYSSDIIEQVKDCDAFMWHHHHMNYRDVIFAKSLLFSLEQSGKKVFPNYKTCWHFDDKVAQKYLLEAIEAPLVPSYVFYDRKQAVDWAKATTYPKVFKLKGGSGAANVKLVENKSQCIKLINKAFGKGFSQFNRIGHFKEKIRKYREDKEDFLQILKAGARLLVSTEFAKFRQREKGYVYLQDFIENEGFDVRVVVINNKAVALKRLVRKNDFRASGSGDLIYENERMDKRYIELSFKINSVLKSDSLALDFIQGKNGVIYVVELSYGFPSKNFLDNSDGYWTKDLDWVNSKPELQHWIIENIIKK